MKLKFLLIAVWALITFPVLAQDGTTHTIAFDNIRFTYDDSIAARVVVEQFVPSPEYPPFVASGIDFLFYDDETPSTREWRPDTRTDAPGIIRISKLEDFGNEQRYGVITLLEMLEQRPDLTPFMEARHRSTEPRLPFLPEVFSFQDIRARVQYVDLEGLSGISYITTFGGATVPFRSHGDLLYTFQGITDNHAHYVSAIFLLSTDLFPSERPPELDDAAFTEVIDDYLAESTVRITAASPDQFSPSLSSLEAMIRSIVIAGSTAVVPTYPVAQEPLWTDDLIGTTWILKRFVTYYDSPTFPHAAETEVPPSLPLTMTFTPEGIRGDTGCNPYIAFLYTENGRFMLGHLDITPMTCDEITMELENMLLDALYRENYLDLTFVEDYIHLRSQYYSLIFEQSS